MSNAARKATPAQILERFPLSHQQPANEPPRGILEARDDEDREQELGRAWKLLEDPDGNPCAMVGEHLVWLTDAHDAQLRGTR